MHYTHQHQPELNQEIARRTLNILEAGEVVRFHAVPAIDGQTVGHHSYGVAAILIAFGCLLDPDDRWLIAEAILHDTAELYTGDIPFTVKRDNSTIKQAMDMLEMQVCMADLFVSSRLTPRQHVLLKVADMLDGLRWCLVGHERGTTIAARWIEAIHKQMLANAGLLSKDERERVWAVYLAIHKLNSTLASPYNTFQSFCAVHAPVLHHNLYICTDENHTNQETVTA